MLDRGELRSVIAHEIGHHVQSQLGISDYVHAQRGRVSEREYNELSVRLELQADFLREAAERQLVSLKGHRSVGGIRASIYNAMPVEGVQALRDFMRDFAS